MKKIAIILNYKNEDTISFAKEIKEFLDKKGAPLMLPQDRPGYSLNDCANVDFSTIDLALLLGGDGTLLAVSKYLSAYDVPMLAINMGRLGFLSEVEKEEITRALDAILAGEYIIDERMMIQGSIYRNKQQLESLSALNDLVIKNGIYLRTIMLDLFINGDKVYSTRTDGMIVSTPTGSTAYSLSAGGPIILPQSSSILITPVCPHTLFSRSIVLPFDSTVRIVYRSESGSAALTADGQTSRFLEENDEIHITASEKKTKLIRLKKYDFFERVRNKLIR